MNYFITQINHKSSSYYFYFLSDFFFYDFYLCFLFFYDYFYLLGNSDSSGMYPPNLINLLFEFKVITNNKLCNFSNYLYRGILELLCFHPINKILQIHIHISQKIYYILFFCHYNSLLQPFLHTYNHHF